MRAKWDLRFMRIAREVSLWSKDPSTRVGSVIVRDRRILSTGYNGFPKGMRDDPELYLDREYKLPRVVHAEKNAVYNAASEGISVAGATVYTFGCPTCCSCALGLIQSGVVEVVACYPDKFREPGNAWASSSAEADALFREVGVSSWVIREQELDAPSAPGAVAFSSSGSTQDLTPATLEEDLSLGWGDGSGC